MSAPRLTYRMREVAEITGASLTVVKGWVSSGRLTSIQPAGPGGVVLIKATDLEAFLDAHREGVNTTPRLVGRRSA
jgi:excisionase family DNA binding protein